MRRVLVVDDSGTARASLRAIVEPFGFTVEEAENGAAALQRLKTAPVELVFVDVHMPVLDGPSLIRMLRAQKIEARVILITTGAPTPMIASAVRLGVSDYVRKPFDPEQVRVSTARALGMDPDALRPTPVTVLLRDLDEDLAQSLHSFLAHPPGSLPPRRRRSGPRLPGAAVPPGGPLRRAGAAADRAVRGLRARAVSR